LPEEQQKHYDHRSRRQLHNRLLCESVALHTALRLASPSQPIMSDNIPFDAQGMPWNMDFECDLNQWNAPDLPDFEFPDNLDWSDSLDAFERSADIPDALGSFDAGPIR
jgi:hypothetical protein